METTPEDLTQSVREALEREPRVDASHHPIRVWLDRGDLVMEGEVEDVAAKKLALERAASLPGVEHIIDRLRVRPAQRMDDGELLRHVRDALMGEPALQHIGLRVRDGAERRVLRTGAPGARGCIEVRVEDGVVTLDGEVSGLAHKRLAGVLAWWVPGARDVVNGIGVDPREQDSDAELMEAVRVALEKDPLVDPGSIQIAVRDRVVTLTGAVGSEAQRDMAEMDAWYVWAVDRVDNQLKVVH